MSDVNESRLLRLHEPFAPSEIEWRIGQAGLKADGKPWAKVLAYVTSRAIQDRLDLVVGPANWWNEFRPGPDGGVLCGITIRMDDGREVTKWDGAEAPDLERVKGGLSDSMKRAAVQWGIARYLYGLGEQWARIHEGGARYCNTKIKSGSGEQWINFRWDPPALPREFVPASAPPPETKPANGAPPPAAGPAAGSSAVPFSAQWIERAERAIEAAGTPVRVNEIIGHLVKPPEGIDPVKLSYLRDLAAQRLAALAAAV